MKDVNGLADEMRSVFSELRAGTIKQKDAAELANIAGKILKAYQIQLAYHALIGEKPEIEFLKAKLRDNQLESPDPTKTDGSK